MPSEEWTGRRLQTTYENARRVLDAQRETAADVDEKAMRTVRITAVIVSGAASLLGITDIAYDPLWATGGLALLVGSLIVGVLTYEESSLYLGPNAE